MTAGRPPAWNPFRATSLCAWTEPVLLATKDRASLPVAVRNLLKLQCPGRLVADMESEGRATLISEDEFATIHDVLANTAENNAQVAIAALDRFQTVPVTAEGRLVLSLALRVHLNAVHESIVRLVVEDGRLTLWSEESWRLERRNRMAQTRAVLSGESSG